MIEIEVQLIEAARSGERAALNEILRSIEKPIFNLALRFLVHKENAEDATQEILIKIITNLGAIQNLQSAGAWASKIATRHLLNYRKKGAIEAARLSFFDFGKDLEDGLENIVDNNSTDSETQLLATQVKIGCTLALLTCLTRPLRASYILGEIYEVSDFECAEVLSIKTTTHRKRLERSRQYIAEFTKSYCGIIEPSAKCHCRARIVKASQLGRIGANFVNNFKFETNPDSIREIEDRIILLEEGRRAQYLQRSNPVFISNLSEILFDEGLL